MREIRFRAWHKTKKAFMYFELGELNDSMITKVEDGWYLDDCEIMQYIGLHDKHGKEIFEGDIVKRGPIHLRVEWMDFTNLQFLKEHANYFEVIGNIYEHLLEPK